MTQRTIGLTAEEELMVMRGAKVLKVSDKPKKRRSPSKPSKKLRASIRDDLQKMASNNDWSHAGGWHFVELTAWMHETTYGVTEAELDAGTGWMGAGSRAAHLLREEFEGDPKKFAEYVRWAWARERGREEWRRKNGQETRFRVSWRVLFGPAFLTDYRVQQHR